IHIHLPPLRDRGADMPRLAQRFLYRHAQLHRRKVDGITDPALSSLHRYGWPGNVRELSRQRARTKSMTSGRTIGPADLRLDGGPMPGAAERAMTLEAIELEAIRAALARHADNVVAATDELGVSRSALYRRMEKFGL